MKLRVTGLLLGILVLVAVMVPAFAAAVDRNDDVESDVSGVTDVVEQPNESLEKGQTDETEEDDSAGPVLMPVLSTLNKGTDSGETEEVIVSDSPYYLDGVQMTALVYEEISGVDYVTIESFLLSMNPEAMVEESKGTVTASAVALSGVVNLDASGNLANVEEETLSLSATKGSYYIVANDRYLYVKNTVKTIDGKVAAPVKVLAKVFNLDVEYDDEDLIQLTTQKGASAYLEDGDSYYDEDTLYWLSRIIYAESGTQSMKGKLAVGNVVMNRVKSSMFPNNIKDVLFQKNQFSPAMSGSIYREPGENSVIAAKMVLDGAVVVKNALFFNREGMNTYASRNRTYVTTIGDHSFYS